MSFTNLSFEIAGDAPGSAFGWSLSFSSSSVYAPVESFSSGWMNDGYVTGFRGPFIDLTPARFRTALPTPLFADGFEEAWGNSSYVFAFAGIASPLGPETFDGWVGGPYLTDFAGSGLIPETFIVDGYVKSFVGSVVIVEAFETDWPLATSV